MCCILLYIVIYCHFLHSVARFGITRRSAWPHSRPRQPPKFWSLSRRPRSWRKPVTWHHLAMWGLHQSPCHHHVIIMASLCHHHVTMLTLNRRQMGYNLVRNVPRRDVIDDSVFCDASMCTMNPSLSVCVCVAVQSESKKCRRMPECHRYGVLEYMQNLLHVILYNT